MKLEDVLALIRAGYTREEIAALFDLPFTDVLFRAASVHRANHPPGL